MPPCSDPITGLRSAKKMSPRRISTSTALPTPFPAPGLQLPGDPLLGQALVEGAHLLIAAAQDLFRHRPAWGARLRPPRRRGGGRDLRREGSVRHRHHPSCPRPPADEPASPLRDEPARGQRVPGRPAAAGVAPVPGWLAPESPPRGPTAG